MRVGVVGAGTMGHGIAQVAAMAGDTVVLYDPFPGAVDKGLAAIRANLDGGVAKGKVTAAVRDQALAGLRAGALADVAGGDLVVEAIPEKLELKQRLFQEIESLVSAETLLASNTSSLPIGEIARGLRTPSRCLGLHFFNPVAVMQLVEIVRAATTSEAAVESAKFFVSSIGKTPIIVKDSPGFATSRLGVVIGLEAIRMLEQGVASAEDIDRAMELGYGYPMGPLKLGDLVGLDVRLAIAEYLYAETGSATFRPPQLLKRLVRAGKLGRKTGEGFYRYGSTLPTDT